MCILTRENCRPVRKFIFLYNYVVLSRDTGRARIIERLIFGSFARQRASHASHSSQASFARPFHIVEGRRHEVVDMHGRGRQRRPAGGVRPCMSTTFDRASGAGYELKVVGTRAVSFQVFQVNFRASSSGRAHALNSIQH